jgi:hypothetical protein
MRRSEIETPRVYYDYFIFMAMARRVEVNGRLLPTEKFPSAVTSNVENDALATAHKSVSSLFVCMSCCPTFIFNLVVFSFLQKFRRE